MQENPKEPEGCGLVVSYPAEFVMEIISSLEKIQNPVVRWNAEQSVMDRHVIQSVKEQAQIIVCKFAERYYPGATPEAFVKNLKESIERCRERKARSDISK